jgi:GDP-D-mannose dehydratase
LKRALIMVSRGNPSKVEKIFDWKAQFHMAKVARMMVAEALEAQCP